MRTDTSKGVRDRVRHRLPMGLHDRGTRSLVPSRADARCAIVSFRIGLSDGVRSSRPVGARP